VPRKLGFLLSLLRPVPGVNARIFALYLQRGLWCFGVQDEVVIAVRAVLVATPHSASVPPKQVHRYVRIFKLARILPKRLLALLADEGHVEGLHQRVISLLGMALCAVEPFFAWPP
jgi:hypothetical protein